MSYEKWTGYGDRVANLDFFDFKCISIAINIKKFIFILFPNANVCEESNKPEVIAFSETSRISFRLYFQLSSFI